MARPEPETYEMPWPEGYGPPCPVCEQPTTGLRDEPITARVGGWSVPVAHTYTIPCNHLVTLHAPALIAAAPGARAVG